MSQGRLWAWSVLRSVSNKVLGSGWGGWGLRALVNLQQKCLGKLVCAQGSQVLYCLAESVSVTVHSFYCLAETVSVTVHSFYCLAETVSITVHSFYCLAESVSVAVHSFYCLAETVSVIVRSFILLSC